MANKNVFPKDMEWSLSPSTPEAKDLADALSLPTEIAQILINRKITDEEAASRFLYGSLDDLHDPFLMAGMKEAAQRIKQAVDRKEKILIFGDYDVDGILSVVILRKALQTLGADAAYFIPDRLKNGYGLKEEYIEIVREKKADLVISVDCGIKAVNFVDKAKEEGVDVIITDHHQPGEVFPRALAILNPVLGHSGYPDKHLAGIGVVFKLIQAILQVDSQSSVIPHYLKLVAIGTVADVAALKGENRLFVKHGLKALAEISNQGLKKLLDVCRLNGENVSVGDVGFRIGPRINAAGRLGQTELAVRLFFSDSPEESAEIARTLDKLNAKRQAVEEKIYKQALSIVESRSLNKRYKLLILGCDEWHRGVIGIVASKLKDDFHRPVILFAYKDGKAFGSGRSIKEFPLIDCLETTREHYINYGGHPLAVGCELMRERMKDMKAAVNEFADAHISHEELRKKIYIDTELNFGDVDSSFLDVFTRLLPFGVGFAKPIFLTEGAEIVEQPRIFQKRHGKLLLRQRGRIFEAMAWSRAEMIGSFRPGDLVDLVYSLQFSSYLGEKTLNLSIEDIKPS